VSTYAYVNPVVAVGLGILLLGERLTASTLVGGVAVLACVALLLLGAARPDPPPAEEETGAEPVRPALRT
jgi:drug/metabolite transporter (DMT)-like permease